MIFTCDAILFDMDGTLIDSTAAVERQWRRWAAVHGLDAERILAVSHGRRTIETMRDVAPHLQMSERDAALFDEEEGRDSEGVTPIAGSRQVLESLPIDRWAVVTSAGTDLARIRFGQAALPMPRVLISADEIREGKPHPEGYLAAADRLRIAPARCLVVEDTPAGIRAGVAAGMQVLSIGTTVPRHTLLGTPWMPDFTHFRVVVGDPLQVLLR